MFEEGKESPPGGRGAPPVAGAVRWARGLFARVGRTLATLQALPDTDLSATDAGRRAVGACTGEGREGGWG